VEIIPVLQDFVTGHRMGQTSQKGQTPQRHRGLEGSAQRGSQMAHPVIRINIMANTVSVWRTHFAGPPTLILRHLNAVINST
jgi:hypothetical protein